MNCKQLVLAFVITGSVFTATAQTEGVSIKSTVGPPDPSAMLDVQSPSKGILIPRVLLVSSSDAVTITNPANSLLVYSTGNVAMPAGYYYNSGTSAVPVWVKLAGGGSGNDLWTLAANNTDIYRQNGNVGIGTTTPHASAALEIKSTNKGLLIPIVGLQNPSDATTIPNPAPFLLTFGGNLFSNTFPLGLYFNASFGPTPNWTKLLTPYDLMWKKGTGNSVNDIYLDATAGGWFVAGTMNRKVGLGTTSPQESFHIKHPVPGIFLDPIVGTEADVKILSKQSGIHLISQGCAALFLDSDENPATHGSEIHFDIYDKGDNFSNSNLIFRVRGNGDVQAKGNFHANVVFQSSDSILKTNITIFAGSSLSKLKLMRPVHYTWKNDTKHLEQTGFIAQEIEQIFPELISKVETEKNDDQHQHGVVTSPADTTSTLSLNYIGIIPHIVKAMQEQQVLIEQLQQQNLLLTNRIQALESH